jgi:hypothetical protein
MKPSRIIKSAYRSARAAGFQGSLKEWARANQSTSCVTSGGHTCTPNAWLDLKAKQRDTSSQRRANLGHRDVHRAAITRSTVNTTRGDAAKSGYPASEGGRR